MSIENAFLSTRHGTGTVKVTSKSNKFMICFQHFPQFFAALHFQVRQLPKKYFKLIRYVSYK